VFTAGCTLVKNDNLNQAALAGDRARGEVLLKSGADVNGGGMHDMKPIMSAARVWAVTSGNEELVRFLLANGADPGWTNSLGNTVLDFARQKGVTNMIPLLQKRP